MQLLLVQRLICICSNPTGQLLPGAQQYNSKECSNELHVHCRQEELAIMARGGSGDHRTSLAAEQNVFVSDVQHGTCDFCVVAQLKK